MIRRLRAELVDPAGARLGEGPVVDPATGRLIWVDILGGVVHFCDPDGVREKSVAVGSHVGAALPMAGGGLLLAVRDGFATLAPDGVPTPLLEILADRPDLRFNDAKVDPRGRAWAGTLSYAGDPGRATLYRLDDGPAATPVLEGLHLSNGLGWSPEGTTMYHIDTYAHRVDAYAYDLDTATIAGGREFAAVPTAMGLPDGLCVDDQGAVWVALHDGSAVARYTPAGVLDTIVELPVPKPTSCTFAGDVLYITTAGGAGPAGGVFAVRPGVSGPPATPWQPVAAGS